MTTVGSMGSDRASVERQVRTALRSILRRSGKTENLIAVFDETCRDIGIASPLSPLQIEIDEDGTVKRASFSGVVMGFSIALSVPRAAAT